MANRTFHRKQALEKEVKDLFLDVSFGASGAPTVNKKYGISSIVRDTNGTYTITLEDKYQGGLKHLQASLIASSAEDIVVQLKSEAVSTTKEIEIFTNTGATPTDPSNGSRMIIQIVVKNTSVV